MTDVDKLSRNFLDFVYEGLDHGINSIADQGGPLTPFVMTKDGDQGTLTRFVTERLELSLAEAEKYVRLLQPKPKFALIVFDGYATVRGTRQDAIIVRSFDKSETEGIIIAQPYTNKISGPGIEPVGNSAWLKYEPNLLLTYEEPIKQAVKKASWWRFPKSNN